MSDASVHTSSTRKDDHVRLATDQAETRQAPSDFDRVTLVHHALRAENVDRVSTQATVLGHEWVSPLYINAMTGGSEKTGHINAALARVAHSTGIALASGSMSHLLKDESSLPTYEVLRSENPNGFVFANLSANAGVEDAERVIDAVQADALQIHVNSAQEMVMPEGDRIFRHWRDNIEALCASISVPVVVKEVGFGMSRETVTELLDLGVRSVDVSGRGGTNFAAIENSRRSAGEYAELAGWGQSTAQCLVEIADVAQQHDITVFASGGVRGPLDVARALSLGATAVGVAGGFLHVLQRAGEQALIEEIQRWNEVIRSIQTLTGARTPQDLQALDVLITGTLREFGELRGVNIAHFATRSSQSHRRFNV